MSKTQIKKIDAKIVDLKAAIVVSRANARNAARAKFRKLAAAKAERLQARISALSAKVAKAA